MKNLILTAGVIISILGLLSFRSGLNEASNPRFNYAVEGGSGFVVPENIKVILDKSCLPCHGVDGSSKAKMKWNYAKTEDLKPSKMVGKLSKIASKVESGKMPTAKFVEKYPDKKLTNDDKKALIDWANGLIEDLTK